MFPVGTTVKDWMQFKACRAKQVVLMGPCHLCHCPSPVVALIPAVSQQLPAVQSTTAALGSLVETPGGVGCPTGLDARAVLDAHLSGRPTISLEAKK